MSFKGFFTRIGEFWGWVLEKGNEAADYARENPKKMVAGGIVVLGLLFAAHLAFFSSSVSIHVTDENDQPISGALVRLYDDEGNLVRQARTDDNGVARFTGVNPNKENHYSAQKEGYETASGTYDLNDPTSATIRLRSTTPKVQEFSNPPLPPQRPPTGLPSIIYPSLPPEIRPAKTTSPGDPSRSSYVADAKLRITVKDQTDNATLSAATVRLSDASTTLFIAQGPTNSQGVLEAGVRKGSTVLIQARASGYVHSEPKTVSIDANAVSVDILMLRESDAASSDITVYDDQQKLVEGARVQVFFSPPLTDQFTLSDGRLTLLLRKDKSYNVLASKRGYKDALAFFAAGENVDLVLSASNEWSAALIVSVRHADASQAFGARVGVFKKIGSDFLPYAGQTTDPNGLARFDPLQTLAVLVNVSAADGTATVTNELVLKPGENRVDVVLDDFQVLVETRNICVNESFRARGTQYRLVDLSATKKASLEVKNDASVTCTSFSPACTYSLNANTADNEALAVQTGVGVKLVGVDLTTGCADFELSISCVGSNCIPSQPTCSLTSGPVCGANDVTYTNTCDAQQAGVAFLFGACTPQTRLCTLDYDPVCGTNRLTYANPCLASLANVSFQAGECQPPAHTLRYELPAGWNLIAPPSSGGLVYTNCTGPLQGYRYATQDYENVLPTQGATQTPQYTNGYWMYAKSDCSVYWQNASAPVYTRTLLPGWNLIGAPNQALPFDQIRGTCPAYNTAAAAATPACKTVTTSTCRTTVQGTCNTATCKTDCPAGTFASSSLCGLTGLTSPTSCSPTLGLGWDWCLSNATYTSDTGCKPGDTIASTSSRITYANQTTASLPTPIPARVSLTIDSASCTTQTVPADGVNQCPVGSVAVGLSVKDTYVNSSIDALKCCRLTAPGVSVTTGPLYASTFDETRSTFSCMTDIFGANARFVVGVRMTAGHLSQLDCAQPIADGGAGGYNAGAGQGTFSFSTDAVTSCRSPQNGLLVDVAGNAGTCMAAVLIPANVSATCPVQALWACRAVAAGTCSSTCTNSCPAGFTGPASGCAVQWEGGSNFTCLASGQPITCYSSSSYTSETGCNPGDIVVSKPANATLTSTPTPAQITSHAPLTVDSSSCTTLKTNTNDLAKCPADKVAVGVKWSFGQTPASDLKCCNLKASESTAKHGNCYEANYTKASGLAYDGGTAACISDYFVAGVRMNQSQLSKAYCCPLTVQNQPVKMDGSNLVMASGGGALDCPKDYVIWSLSHLQQGPAIDSFNCYGAAVAPSNITSTPTPSTFGSASPTPTPVPTASSAATILIKTALGLTGQDASRYPTVPPTTPLQPGYGYWVNFNASPGSVCMLSTIAMPSPITVEQSCEQKGGTCQEPLQIFCQPPSINSELCSALRYPTCSGTVTQDSCQDTSAGGPSRCCSPN